MTLSLHATILGLLAQRPMCQPQLARSMLASPAAVGKVLARLAMEKQIRFCGLAIDAGLSGERAESPMWGLRDAKPFFALDRNGVRIECAACGSHRVYRGRRRGNLQCRTCNTYFHDGEERPEAEESRRRSCGSGHIADRITVGRGSRWAWAG